jgi:hypothetical protein
VLPLLAPRLFRVHAACSASRGQQPCDCTVRVIMRGVISTACLLVALASSSASAQYFGRNKVQYKKLDFQVLKTDHFDMSKRRC